ncbi:sulfatase family protein [Flavivirga eckloniae]|uniref:Sulfatase n=1 Tax=Flavivirga eckloniae TaxID=1803846 RepID=A0A2K9PU52_9FLAO|nr:arylsulfatase [Flavivirga eckloniae]AUP80569.1 sulfatase [Flavivirga eckloniae]
MTQNILKTLFLYFLALSIQSFGQSKPNVIVVLADDIGVGDISHYRKRHSDKIIVETPALDKLAKEGIIFTDARSPAALCAPTRYAIMTGNHCYRSYAPWGVWGSYQRSPLKPNQLTLGSLMKNAGYKTSFFGKWGFGIDFPRKDDITKVYRGDRSKPELDVNVTKVLGNGPKQHGFDYSLLFPAGIQDVPYVVYENEQWMPLHKKSEITYISQENMTKIGVKLDKSEGLGDSYWDPHDMGPLLANKAVEYIKSSKKNEPFFMYYCALAVHKPHTPAASLNGKSIAGTTPSKHLDLVKELDIQMDMLIKTLKQKGIYENTLIIFTSDNGGLLIPETLKSGHRPSDIYRGGKNQRFEGGNKVPFIVSWPAKIKPNRMSNKPVIGIDIMATLAAITNQKFEEDQAMDSSNLLPILVDEKDIETHPFVMIQAGTGKEVIIVENNWKLIIQVDKKDRTDLKRHPIALFNLTDNPSEKGEKNLISNAKYKAKIDKLLNLYNSTRDSKIKTGYH